MGPTLERCAGCHLDGFANGGFSFDRGLADLVDVPSRIGMPYITPGSPEESYLWHKLAGTQLEAGGFGARMPIGLPLSEGELEVISGWIEAGAR